MPSSYAAGCCLPHPRVEKKDATGVSRRGDVRAGPLQAGFGCRLIPVTRTVTEAQTNGALKRKDVPRENSAEGEERHSSLVFLLVEQTALSPILSGTVVEEWR